MRDADALQTTSNLPMTRGKKWRERQRREICTFCFYICESCCGRREHIKGKTALSMQIVGVHECQMSEPRRDSKRMRRSHVG